MNLKSVVVTEKKVLETDQMKDEYIFLVKMIYSTSKVIFDYYLLLYFAFIYRFKVFRCYTDVSDNSFNFTLKLRDLNAVTELMRK